MLRTSAHALLGALLLVAGAAALAPAALLDSPLAARTHDRLRLADAHGFWWRGRGAIVTADGAIRMPIGWRVDLAPLARGALVFHLASVDDAAPGGTIAITEGRTDVRDLHLQVPAAGIGALDPRLKTFALGGNVTVDVPAVTSHGDVRTGGVNARWDRARVAAGAEAMDLGTVSLATAPGANPLAGTIRNVAGDIAIDGTFADRAGVLDVTLSLRPTAAAPDIVHRTLAMLGTPDATGGVRVAWRSDR